MLLVKKLLTSNDIISRIFSQPDRIFIWLTIRIQSGVFMPKYVFFRETIILQKFRQNDSFIKQIFNFWYHIAIFFVKLTQKRKNSVKIRQFHEFFFTKILWHFCQINAKTNSILFSRFFDNWVWFDEYFSNWIYVFQCHYLIPIVLRKYFSYSRL